jgi:4-carboxymuconolactone decarboxylase
LSKQTHSQRKIYEQHHYRFHSYSHRILTGYRDRSNSTSKQSYSAQNIEVISQEQTQLENQSRRKSGNEVINKLTGGAGQPVLDALRRDFPFLADAIVDYSLGEVWSRQGLDDRTRQLATVAAFAATGNLPQLKIHAGYALRLGATQDELKEIIYLTTVTAGFPRSIDAAQALREVFTAQ